jgi:hypothetical protein
MMANNAIILTCGVLLIAPLLVVAKKCTLCPYGPVFLPDGDLSFLFEDSTKVKLKLISKVKSQPAKRLRMSQIISKTRLVYVTAISGDHGA